MIAHKPRITERRRPGRPPKNPTLDPPPDVPVHNPAGSFDHLAVRVRAVSQARAAGDEPATRTELRMLANEARTLAATVPLFAGTTVARRQRIATEREPSGRLN